MSDIEGQARGGEPPPRAPRVRALIALGCVAVFVLDLGLVLLGLLASALAGLGAWGEDDWAYRVDRSRFTASWLILLAVAGCVATVVAWRLRRGTTGRLHGLESPILLVAALAVPIGWLSIGTTVFQWQRPPPLPIVRDSTAGHLDVLRASSGSESIWSVDVTCDWQAQGTDARVDDVGPIGFPIAEDALVTTASGPVGGERGWSGTLTSVSPTCEEGDVGGSACGVCTELWRDELGVSGCDEVVLEGSADGSSGTARVDWLDPGILIRWTCQPRP